MKDLKAAYRDAMSIWHPDRFPGNPRLRRKAEKKAAQINQAYEVLAAHISRSEGQGDAAGGRRDGPAPESTGAGSRTERFVEAGTMAILHFGHAVYSVFRKKNHS